MLTKLTMIIIIITIKRSDLGFVIHYIFGPYELWLVAVVINTNYIVIGKCRLEGPLSISPICKSGVHNY